MFPDRSPKNWPTANENIPRCKIYDGFYQLLNQWNQPWQCLRDHRAWIHHGLWNRENVKLRPWRYHHGRKLRGLYHDTQYGNAGLLKRSPFCHRVLGIVIERVAYKPLRDASPLSVLITAIGVSYLLQNIALLLFGADTKSFTSVVTIPALKFADGAITVTGETLVTIISCIVIMIGLTTFINKTKAGQAMLAVSEDRGAATLMGVNVNGTIALTFAIGSALAAVAGVLLCSAYPSLTPYTGSMPGIKAFVAAVFGGIGSIPGALIGGILLGIIEILSKAYISSQLSDAIVFSVLIIVLLVRPTGILGKKLNEKV